MLYKGSETAAKKALFGIAVEEPATPAVQVPPPTPKPPAAATRPFNNTLGIVGSFAKYNDFRGISIYFQFFSMVIT